MICFDCKNKTICRHFQNFIAAMDVVHFTITHCDRFEGTEEAVKAPTPTKKPLVVAPVAHVDRLLTGYPDFNASNKEKQNLEIVAGKKNDDLVIKPPEFFTGTCEFCEEKKETYVCVECGKVCCEDCGMPPYCKSCWEDK